MNDAINALLAHQPDARTRVLLDALPQLVWTCDSEGWCDYLNDPWATYTGVPEADQLGHGWLTAVHADDRATTNAIWAAANVSGSPFELDYRLRAGDGTYRWFKARGNPIRNADGSVVRWVGTSTDIDSQKRSENAMRFIAEASELLAPSLDIDPTLRAVADLAVQHVADWCGVYLRKESGSITPVAIAHRNPERIAFVTPLVEDYPTQEGEPLAEVIRTGEAVFMPHIPQELLVAAARDERHLNMILDLHLHSAIIVPLVGRERTFGAIQLVNAESDRRFTEADFQLAQLLAKRAAVAIENAQLFERHVRSERRLRFLAETSTALSGSLELNDTLRTLVRIIVPEFADWAALDLINDDGVFEGGYYYHHDPERDSAARAFGSNFRVNTNLAIERVGVLKSGRSRIRLNVDARELEKIIVATGMTDVAAAALRELGYHSSIVVPLFSEGRIRGVLSAIWSSQKNYTDDDVVLFEEIARRAALAVEHAASFERERRVSDTLQRALLPDFLPTVPGLAFSATYSPGLSEARVGGDWYDAFELEDGRIAVSIGDVTGRGLQAAVIMGKMRQAIKTLALYESDPSRLLDIVDRELKRTDPEALVTALVGVFDPAQSTLAYATAGHPPPFVRYPDGRVETLPARGLPLGLRGSIETPTATVRLPIGSLVVLYTDGLTESTRDVNEGEARVIAALGDASVLESGNLAAQLQETVVGGASQDDVAILTIELTGAHHASGGLMRHASDWTMRWAFDARDARLAHEVRTVYMNYLRARGDATSDYDAAEIVFGELISNVVRHAPGPIEIELEWNGIAPVLHVLDRGAGFERGAELPTDPLSEFGRGLWLVRTLTEDFSLTDTPGYGTHARTVLPIRRHQN